MIKLRTALLALLKTVHERVYFNEAPESAAFPYVVYNLPNSFRNEDQEIYNLDVDIWDNNKDTTAIETLTDNIGKTLHKYKHIDNDLQMSINKNTLLVLTDDNPQIKRRRLTFEVKTFYR